MKILFANKFFFVNGGSERVFFQERDFCKSIGFDVVDFSMKDERNFASEQSAYFVRSANYKNGGLIEKISSAAALLHSREAVRKIGLLIENEKPDILHCHNIYHQLTPSIIRVAHSYGVKTVLTLHDSKVVCPTYLRVRNGNPCSDCLNGDFFNVVRHRCADGSFTRSALLYAESKFQKFLGSYELLDRLIAPSAFMRDSVTLSRFPTERVDLIYNGIDLDSFSVSSSDNGYALYLGRLSAEKGLITLGKAQVLSGGSVKVAGDGPLLNLLAQDYPGLELLGYQSGNALRRLIEGASMIVLPSEVFENCPMSVLEAMASGKPVIGSRMGGIPELIEDGVTGRLFEAGNAEQLASAMRELFANVELRRDMGVRARTAVEKRFSLKRHNTQLLALYESLLQ